MKTKQRALAQSQTCLLLGAGAVTLLFGCGDSTSTDMTGATSDKGGPVRCQGPAYSENVTSCMPAATDYRPRVNMSMSDSWAMCISDDNMFHMVGTSVPAAASRTQAFEAIANRLWRNEKPLTINDFLLSRNDYSIMEGLGSRVARRQDVHYPEIGGTMKLICGDEGVPAMYPDRCAGPAKVKPIIDDAFARGLMGDQPRIQTARLEASLLFFFYLSTLSEIWTCGFDDIADCDSVLGYMNGFQPRATPIGFGKYMKDLGPETYDRAFDGVLAERCWRDLDRATVASNQTLYMQAQSQLDRAELRGLALILRDRFGQIGCATGDMQQAHLAFVSVLGGFLDRAARAIDASKADQLKAQYTASSAAQVDVAKAQQLLDQLFPCP